MSRGKQWRKPGLQPGTEREVSHTNSEGTNGAIPVRPDRDSCGSLSLPVSSSAEVQWPSLRTQLQVCTDMQSPSLRTQLQVCRSHRDTLAYTAWGVNRVPCSPLGMCKHRTGDRKCGQPKLKPHFSGQHGCDWLGSPHATSSGLPSNNHGGVIFASLLLMAEVSLFSRCLS